MKILETERLIIEEANLNDADFFLPLVNSPNWLKFIGDRNIKTIEEAQKYIQESLLNSYAKNGFGLYKLSLKTTNQFIGTAGFLKRDYLDFPDMGYAILPKYENKGYISEATKAILEYGHTTFQFQTILAIVKENNLASKKILSKLGLQFVDKITLNGEELLYYST